MTLAEAIKGCYGFEGSLEQFVTGRKRLKLLEINEAGHLNQYLKKMPGHKLVAYPEVDMRSLPFEDNTFDIIVHSDTLEHIEDPVKALEESWRVLAPGGYTCFTTPIITGRMTTTRNRKKPSYHGSPGNNEYLVQNEYGADIWTQVMKAGFSECRLTTLDFPASIAVIGVKNGKSKSSNKLRLPRIIIKR
jgi:SAM-dependent methyltransferase